MQPIKLNSQKRFNEITKGKKLKTDTFISEITELKEGVSLPNLEESAEEKAAIEQNDSIVASKEKLKSIKEKLKNFFEQKITGAISEILRRKELDENVEKSLSEGLEKNEDFIKEDKKINKKRNLFSEKIRHLIKKQSSDTKDVKAGGAYEFDEMAEQAMRELEQEIGDDFTKYVYEKLGKINKNVLLEHLVDNPANLAEVKIIDLPTVSDAYENVVAFSDNGYLIQMINKEEARNEGGIVIDGDTSKYNLIAPNGSVLSQNLNYKEALEFLKRAAAQYHEVLVAEFTPQKDIQNDFNENQDKALDEVVDSKNNDNLENEKIFFNPFNNEVSAYAKKIGIKLEELANNNDFLSLNSAEQQFVLETLRRSSLSRVKVAANDNFNQEVASKKWFGKIGFLMNQNYHKERHQNEALQNIEKLGLAGYGGENELTWLIDVVKNGPEVKANEQGELKVDCLRADSFKPEELEKIEAFNRLAEEYIQIEKNKKSQEEAYRLSIAMEKIIREFLDNEEDMGRYLELCEIFQKAKSNINLIKFLSGDPETQEVLDKMSQTSSDNKLSAAWGMIKGQKDKLGYAGLGFVLRTGTKFALANAAVFSAAISFSVAPLAAAAVGAFRGHNLGKKEIKEKEELARLGLKDRSGLTKNLNIASGVKRGENSDKEIVFGLTEKLQNLINKVKEGIDSGADAGKLRNDLLVRVRYTEDKIARESVSYGPVENRGSNYFNLINTLGEARVLLGISGLTSFSEMYYRDTKSFYSSENLDNIRKEDQNFDRHPKEGESNEAYEKRLAEHKSRVVEGLEKFDVEQRLSAFLNYQANKQNKKERAFLIKKMGQSAIMGATFASIGSFLADKVGLSEVFSKSSGSEMMTSAEGGTGTGTGTPESVVASGGESSLVVPPVVVSVEDSVSENIAHQAHPITVETENISPIETSKAGGYSDAISNKELNGKSDSIWRSVREIFKKNAADLGYKGDLDDVQAINKWAETQTAVAVNNSEGMDRIVFEGNKVELTRDGDGFKINVEKGEGITPREMSDISANRTENLEETKIDLPGLRQEIPQEEISANTIREQVSASGASGEQITSTPPNESVEEVATNETKVEQPVSKVDTPREDVNDLAAKKMAKLVKGGNIAHNVSGEIYSGRFKNTEEFLSRLGSFNKELGFELSDAQKTEASGIWDSFKSHNDYNILRRSLDSFETRVISSMDIPVENTIEKPIDMVTQSVTSETKISNLENISKELNLKPENLSQEGSSLVYEKSGLGKVFLEADGKSISKVIAPDNQEIPQDFIKENIGRRDLGRFTKQGGLDKILNNWNKLSWEDKLTLRTIDWINKSPEKWPPTEIFTQLKAIFKVNTDNLIYDSAGKKILIKGDSRAFSMTLDGLKEMAKYLNK